jgi:hypothetical protein
MRILQKRRYLFAFIITAAIFFIGFFFGFLMDIQRADYFNNMNNMQKLDIRSLELQQQLLKDNTFKNQCSAFRFMFDKSIVELENSRDRLESYTEQSKVKQADFELLFREYTISQINFLSIAKNLKTACANSSDFVTVIYFYSDQATCPSCEKQAVVLDYYKMHLKQNVLIFAINEKLGSEEPLIELLKNVYNITVYPTLIIENDVHAGYVDKETMNTLLCEKYQSTENKNLICEQSLV